MRIPKKPPNHRDTFQALLQNPERLSTVLTGIFSPFVGSKYLHWDELLHRAPPEGLSREEYWCGIKLQRNQLFKEIPLRDKTGRPFQYTLVDPVPEALHHIDLGAGGHIQMPDQITNPETRDRYYVGSLIEEAITSSQLEGAATTRQVAKEMIRSGRRPTDTGEQMILNNFLTMRKISDLKEEAMSKELVFDIHRLITEGTLGDSSAAGRFRKTDERVVVTSLNEEICHVPPPADELDARMKAFCDFANGRTPTDFVHPAIRAIVLHFWLAYDHPFVDGNGRTARALFYWSMLRNGFWLFEFVSISQLLLKAPSKYSRAFLYTETDDNDLTYFILHQLDVIKCAIQQLHEYIERKTRELHILETELRGTTLLNHRQRALIGHALRHPHFRYTIESHRKSHNVVYQTARADLLNLRDRGLLSAVKVSKTWYFKPKPDLEPRLRNLSEP